MESESSTEEVESSAWRNLRYPAATEVLNVDVQGRVQFTYGGTAPPFLEGLNRRDLLRSATVTPAAYLRTEAGATWRVRRFHAPAGPSADGAPDDPARDAASAPRERARHFTESRPLVFVGDDPALRALLNGCGFNSREKDIALLAMRGLSNKLIARRLGGLNPIGVRDGLRRIFAKIGARSRTEMIARILRIECVDATETRRLQQQ